MPLGAKKKWPNCSSVFVHFDVSMLLLLLLLLHTVHVNEWMFRRCGVKLLRISMNWTFSSFNSEHIINVQIKHITLTGFDFFLFHCLFLFIFLFFLVIPNHIIHTFACVSLFSVGCYMALDYIHRLH